MHLWTALERSSLYSTFFEVGLVSSRSSDFWCLCLEQLYKIVSTNIRQTLLVLWRVDIIRSCLPNSHLSWQLGLLAILTHWHCIFVGVVGWCLFNVYHLPVVVYIDGDDGQSMSPAPFSLRFFAATWLGPPMLLSSRWTSHPQSCYRQWSWLVLRILFSDIQRLPILFSSPRISRGISLSRKGFKDWRSEVDNCVVILSYCELQKPPIRTIFGEFMI